MDPLCEREVGQSRISLTEGLCDDRCGVVIIYGLCISQSSFHVIDGLGVSTEKPGDSEAGVHLVDHVLRALYFGEVVREERKGGFERLLRFGQVARAQVTKPRAVVTVHGAF